MASTKQKFGFLFRVEHRYYRNECHVLPNGPYHWRTLVKKIHNSLMDDTRPAPFSDGITHNDCNYYGMRSMKELLWWFGDDPKIMSDLVRNNFVVRCYYGQLLHGRVQSALRVDKPYRLVRNFGTLPLRTD